jgi:hypothetical protein
MYVGLHAFIYKVVAEPEAPISLTVDRIVDPPPTFTTVVLTDAIL